MLEQLHQANMGIEITKWRSRVRIVWPQNNQQIENMVKKCSTCQQNERKQQREPMKASDVPHIHFRWLNRVYVTGMVKILSWWLITTADIRALRSFTKQILQHLSRN